MCCGIPADGRASMSMNRRIAKPRIAGTKNAAVGKGKVSEARKPSMDLPPNSLYSYRKGACGFRMWIPLPAGNPLASVFPSASLLPDDLCYNKKWWEMPSASCCLDSTHSIVICRIRVHYSVSRTFVLQFTSNDSQFKMQASSACDN